MDSWNPETNGWHVPRFNHPFSRLFEAKPNLDTLNTTTPLLTEVLLTWLTDSLAYFKLTNAEQTAAAAQGLSKPQGLGHGFGLGFALFIMQGENGSTFIPYAFSNTNVEMSSLVSDVIHLLYHYSIRIHERWRITIRRVSFLYFRQLELVK